jgi:serine protease
MKGILPQKKRAWGVIMQLLISQTLRYPPMVFRMVKTLRFLRLVCLLSLIIVACQRGPVFTGPSFLSVQAPQLLSPTRPSQAFAIKNATRTSVSWSLRFEPAPSNPQPGNWFSVTAKEGTVASNSATPLALTLNAGLAAGLYETTATLSYGEIEERFLIVGQVPGRVTGTASVSGTVTTDNALISVLGETEPLPSEPPFLESPLDAGASYVPGQVLVKYKEAQVGDSTFGNLSAQQLGQRQLLSQNLSADYQLEVLEAGAPGETDLLATTQNAETLAQQLNRDPRVEYATPNYYLQALDLPDDPDIQEQFASAMVGLPVAWSVETGSSKPVTVAVLDTGFDLNHEDLRDRFLPGYDFCSDTKIVSESNNNRSVCSGVDADPGFTLETNFHGTHVAGILAATGNNAIGVAGTAHGSAIKLVPIKIFDDTGFTANIDTFAKGIRWAVGLNVRGVPANTNPARIINLSLGGEFFEADGDDNDSNNPVNKSAVRFMQDAVNAATDAGALLVAATGNKSTPYVFSPAAADRVLAVGSVERDLSRSSFSNTSSQQLFGPGVVDLMAPGNGVLSTLPENNYGTLQGTSMSAPLVSGIAALLLSREPQLSPQELEARLLGSVYFDPSSMDAVNFGKGIVRADLAFGLPGPGTNITLALGGNATTTTQLGFYGVSGPFTLPNLAPGTYRLAALANGAGKQLVSSQEVTVQDGTQTFTVPLQKP